MAKTRIEVKKTGSESPTGLLRRFSRRVQDAGIIIKVKGGRYFARTQSKYKSKVSALHKLESRAKYEKLRKLGKIS
jgi:ribosomal protein S21